MKIEIDIPEATIHNIGELVNADNRNEFILTAIHKQLRKHKCDVANNINVYSDGACLGNPGPMGVGVWIPDFPLEISDFVGRGTNNIAEWTALLYAVKIVIHEAEINPGKIEGKKIIFHLDSELVVKQVNGEYAVNNNNLIDLSKEVKKEMKILDKLCTLDVRWIPREKNKKADSLSKKAAKTQTQIDDYKEEDRKCLN